MFTVKYIQCEISIAEDFTQLLNLDVPCTLCRSDEQPIDPGEVDSVR